MQMVTLSTNNLRVYFFSQTNIYHLIFFLVLFLDVSFGKGHTKKLNSWDYIKRKSFFNIQEVSKPNLTNNIQLT